ncbi:creatinase/Prolidase N-terminal domain protein [Mycobacterium intracellulare]|nr:creatinase/Prolidase N-terminal domain protein [Mycobacterium intracellulare]
MDEHGLDILVLGRQANIRYVTGAPQLWIAGTRPFGPMCVLVRATQDIYLNSTDDEGSRRRSTTITSTGWPGIL